MRKIKFEEGYIDKDILKKMNKREKELEDKIKKLKDVLNDIVNTIHEHIEIKIG